MKLIARTILLLLAVVMAGCNRDGGSSTRVSSVSVWPTNSYRHLEHITNLVQQANVIMATNQALFSQWNAHGNLPKNSPLRGLLGIPETEPARMTWIQTADFFRIIIRSSKTEQLLGQIKINLHSRHIESVQDVESLFLFNEMETQLRQIAGTRERALKLFGLWRSGESHSSEQEQAFKKVVEALFLPAADKASIDMSAASGTNLGQGHLTVVALMPDGNPWPVAEVSYPVEDSLFNILAFYRLTRFTYTFGGLKLYPAWTNANTQGFLLDADGFPYSKAPSTSLEIHTNAVY
jgi:hypothetical protein